MENKQKRQKRKLLKSKPKIRPRFWKKKKEREKRQTEMLHGRKKWYWGGDFSQTWLLPCSGPLAWLCRNRLQWPINTSWTEYSHTSPYPPPPDAASSVPSLDPLPHMWLHLPDRNFCLSCFYHPQRPFSWAVLYPIANTLHLIHCPFSWTDCYTL